MTTFKIRATEQNKAHTRTFMPASGVDDSFLVGTAIAVIEEKWIIFRIKHDAWFRTGQATKAGFLRYYGY